MSDRPDRQTILVIGVPGSGKTAEATQITDEMILEDGIDTVYALDTLEQLSVGLEPYIGDLEQQLEILMDDEQRVNSIWRDRGREEGLRARQHDGPLIRTTAEYSEYCELFAAAQKSKKPLLAPPRVIWRCGPLGASYGPAIAEACDQGHTALFMPETRLWYPNFRHEWPINEIPGRPDLTMEHLITMGRAHIRNRHGQRTKIHLVLEAQSFMMLHNYVRNNCEIVICGRLEGGEAFDIVRREFGDGTRELVDRVRKLENHEWIAVRGKMPPVGPYRGGGR